MGDDQARIAALEARVAQLESTIGALLRTAAPPTAAPGALPAPPPPAAAMPPPPAPGSTSLEAPTLSPESAAPPRPQRALDSEAALTWGGVGLVVLAAGFAVSTAIQRGWIGPRLQLAGALLFAAALIGTGWRLRAPRPAWSHTLIAGGIAVVMITFASSLFLDEASVNVAFGCVAVSAFAGPGLARAIPSEWVAAVAAAGGWIAWLVIADGNGPLVASTLVLAAGFVVNVGLALERHWGGLRFLAAAIGLVTVMALAVVADTGLEYSVTFGWASLIAALLFLAPSVQPSRGAWRSIDLRLPTVLAPWLWFVVAAPMTETDIDAGLIGLLVAAGVAAVSLVLRPQLINAHLVGLLVGVSTTFTASLAVVWSTDAVWAVAAVQGVGLLVLARAMQNDWLVYVNAGFLLVTTALFAGLDGAAAWETNTSVASDISRLVIVVAIGVGTWIIGQIDIRRVGGVVVLVLALVWLGSVLVHLPQGQAAVSLSWAVVGVGLLIAGAVRKFPELANAGLAVLVLTVAKLLLVDMAEVDTLWRAGLFLIIGLVFVRLGFVLPRWVEGEASTSVPSDRAD